MAFGIGADMHKNGRPDMSAAAAGLENIGRRRSGRSFQEIAVKCWFTSQGKAMPLMFKFKDENEEIHPVDNVHVVFSEKLLYAGVPLFEYHCFTMLENRKYDFILRFYPEKCIWKFAWV